MSLNIKQQIEDIKIPYNDVDILESSHSVKLVGQQAFLQFNYFNVIGYDLQEIKKGFLGLKKAFLLIIYETFYDVNNKFKAMFKQTKIESSQKNILEFIIEKIELNSTIAKEIDFNLKANLKPIIFNEIIFNQLLELKNEINKKLNKYPLKDNFYKKVLSFKIEKYENDEEIYSFFRNIFTLHHLIIEDMYIDTKNIYKELYVYYNSDKEFFVHIKE